MTTAIAEPRTDNVEVLEGLVTINSVARVFCRTPLTILTWMKRERLPYVRIPGDARDSIRFRMSAVLEWGKRNNKAIRRVPPPRPDEAD